jgi:pimeloyl-ACP methyl ester carboxylesterase
MKALMEPEVAGLVQVNHRSLYVMQFNCSGRQSVVLLHHGLGSGQAWKNQIPALVNEGYSVIVYDRWGYGRSDDRTELLTPGFEQDLSDFQAVIQHIGVKSFILIGHSDGGTLGLTYAMTYPEQVRVLVLIAAHIYFEPKMETGTMGVRQQYLHDDRFRKALARVHKDKVDQVFTNWFEGWHQAQNRSWDMRPGLDQISCPCLVIQGLLDEYANPQHAVDLADAIPNAQLWLVPDARHMLPQEQPDLFNKRLLEYLQSVSSGE